MQLLLPSLFTGLVLCAVTFAAGEATSKADEAITDAIELLTSRQREMPSIDQKAKIDRAIAELRKTINAVEPARDGKQVVTPLQLRKLFSGKAIYDEQSGLLTLTYDLTKKEQLKDFDTAGANVELANGWMTIGPADQLKHNVQWQTVSVTCNISVSQLRGTAVKTSSGVSFDGGGAYADWLELSIPKEKNASIQVPNTARKGRFPLKLELLSEKVNLAYGDLKLGKAARLDPVGNILFCGGTAGYGFSKIVMAGMPDPAWLSQFQPAEAGEQKP